MPDYRLTTDGGDVVAEQTLDHDRLAVTWRSRHQFEAPTADTSRQLGIERRLDDGSWVHLEAPLGTSEVD